MSMLCPLKTDAWTLMQDSKNLDFVHTIKETAPFSTASLHNFDCKGALICYSWSWSHSQSFLFSSQLSQYPAASCSRLSFSTSSRHLRFLHRPSRQDGHLCFSPSSGHRDNVLERARMNGETSFSLCSSSSCSSAASSALREEISSLLLLAKERSRDWSCFSSRSTSGFLWLLPTWTFRPRWESDVNSHWSHLNFLAPVLWSEGVEEIAACSSISLLGGSPFSTTRRWW